MLFMVIIKLIFSENEVNILQQSNKPLVFTKLSGKQSVAFGNCHILKPNRKVTFGRQKFEEIIEKKFGDDKLVEELLKLLKDKTKYVYNVSILCNV